MDATVTKAQWVARARSKSLGQRPWFLWGRSSAQGTPAGGSGAPSQNASSIQRERESSRLPRLAD
eukprot:1716461-Amphidinium_carterae.5